MKLTPKQSELAPKALTFIRDDFARQDAAELQHWGKHLHAGSGVSNIAVGEHLGTGKKDTWSLLSKLVSAGLLRVASSHTGTGEQRRGWAGGGAANFHKEHWNYTQVTYTVEHYRITPEGEAWLAVSARSNPARMTTAEALDALRDATTGEEVEAIADAYAEGEKHRHWSDQDNATIIDRHAGIWYLTPPREDDNGVMQKARRSCCEKGSPSIDMGREYMLPPMTVERSIRLRNLLSQAAFDREHAQANPGASAPTEVQSLLFRRELWTPQRAEAWLRQHNFPGIDLDEKPNTLRYRQADPDLYWPGSFRTIPFGSASGIQAVVGKRKRPTRANPKPRITPESEFIGLFQVRDAFAGREILSKDILEEVAWELGYEGEPWSAIERFEPLAVSYGADLHGAYARGAKAAPRANPMPKDRLAPAGRNGDTSIYRDTSTGLTYAIEFFPGDSARGRGAWWGWYWYDNEGTGSFHSRCQDSFYRKRDALAALRAFLEEGGDPRR